MTSKVWLFAAGAEMPIGEPTGACDAILRIVDALFCRHRGSAQGAPDVRRTADRAGRMEPTLGCGAGPIAHPPRLISSANESAGPIQPS